MTLQLFDSHCHLQDEAFDEDRETVYQRARAQGIGMMVPGYSMTTSGRAIALANQLPFISALIGVHPHDAKEVVATDLQTLREWSSELKVVGIGEIGLDYHYMNSPMETQRAVFLQQLRLARELGLPVSVHSREAEQDTLDLLDEVPGISGVLHCFTGSWDFAEALLSRGFYISFAGPISFKNAQALREVAARVPTDRLLVETDAPYLSPAPWRGQRNEPLRVIRNAEIIAAQKNCSTKEVFAFTMSNTYNLFSRAGCE
ncbi:MAG: TatD family hydrolase [Firmicutes bacterium]|jgi:TatD DNase family protein|nr:TatD family hydrolase [Bacillota bacterium]MCL5972028.1 TatD family hydrolase [Bacillota bacterium]